MRYHTNSTNPKITYQNIVENSRDSKSAAKLAAARSIFMKTPLVAALRVSPVAEAVSVWNCVILDLAKQVATLSYTHGSASFVKRRKKRYNTSALQLENYCEIVRHRPIKEVSFIANHLVMLSLAAV